MRCRVNALKVLQVNALHAVTRTRKPDSSHAVTCEHDSLTTDFDSFTTKSKVCTQASARTVSCAAFAPASQRF
jgi:hypothetical protein